MVLLRYDRLQGSGVRAVRERSNISSKNKHTKHYVAQEQGNEVAFVSLDIVPNVEYLVLYELFVPLELRHAGVGSRVLDLVESFAGRLGYREVTLNAHPFESNYPTSKLIKWYKQRGYKLRSKSGDLYKSVATARPRCSIV